MGNKQTNAQKSQGEKNSFHWNRGKTQTQTKETKGHNEDNCNEKKNT